MEDDRRHREKGQKDLSHSTGLNERYSTRQRKGRTSVVSFLYTLHNPPPLLLSTPSPSVFLPRHPGNKTRNSSSRRCVVVHYSQLICTKPRRAVFFRYSIQLRRRKKEIETSFSSSKFPPLLFSFNAIDSAKISVKFSFRSHSH